MSEDNAFVSELRDMIEFWLNDPIYILSGDQARYKFWTIHDIQGNEYLQCEIVPFGKAGSAAIDVEVLLTDDILSMTEQMAEQVAENE